MLLPCAPSACLGGACLFAVTMFQGAYIAASQAVAGLSQTAANTKGMSDPARQLQVLMCQSALKHVQCYFELEFVAHNLRTFNLIPVPCSPVTTCTCARQSCSTPCCNFMLAVSPSAVPSAHFSVLKRTFHRAMYVSACALQTHMLRGTSRHIVLSVQPGDLVLLLRSSKLHPTQVYPDPARAAPAIGEWRPHGRAAIRLASSDASDSSEWTEAAVDEDHDRASRSHGAHLWILQG